MTHLEQYNRGKLGIISCESGKHFAKKVLKELQQLYSAKEEILFKKTKEIIFANTEIKTEIEECIRNQDIYIFQDVQNNENNLNVNDNIMALKTAINAAKLANAHFITAVIPAFPYARQDKPKTREGITAAMIARELEDCGANRIITLDIHNEVITGFFRRATLENLRVSKELIKYIKEKINTDNLIIVSPDTGGADRANYFAKKLGTKLAMIYKERDYSKANTIDNMSLIGDVKDKDVFIIDDILDTAGTLINAAKKLKDEGAKKIYFGASLTLLSHPAVERINKAYKEGIITKIIGTNTIYRTPKFKEENPWYEEINLEKYFAKVIYNINKGESIGKLIE